MAGRPLRIATRGSALARSQAESVARRLAVPSELVIVSTIGDDRRDVPIWRMGGRGVFVKEVQQAVLEGRADLAVHSAKDLPSTTPPGLTLAAFPERIDPRDALVGCRLADLPTGATVATGSSRRRAQLAWLRPDLLFAPMRGNVDTRITTSLRHDAGVLAHAGVLRMGREDGVAEVLDPSVMLPQVGQGALAVECRHEDDSTRDALNAIDDPRVRLTVSTERAFLATLGGGCNLPVGALAELAGELILIEAMVASLDGRVVLRHRHAGSDPDTVGRETAQQLMESHGGRALEGVSLVQPGDEEPAA